MRHTRIAPRYWYSKRLKAWRPLWPVAGGTLAQDNFNHHVWDRVKIALLAATVINQGDMVFFVNGNAQPASAVSGLFIGVSEATQPVTSLGGSVGTSAQGIVSFPNIVARRNGAFRFFTTAGEVYNAFDTVYVGADAQTITKVAGASTKVGWIDPADIVLNGGPVTGAAGVRISVGIVPNFP